MKRPSPLGLGILLGIAFTLVMNTANIRAWTEQRLTIADLGAEIGSADEIYYFALMQDVRDGHLNLGNASLFEYQNAPAVAGFALLPQGLLAAYTRLELATVVLLGDILFPLITTALAFLIFRRFFGSDVLSALFALAYMCYWGGGWQRSMHPQVTMVAFFLSLFAFVSDPDGTKMYPRGAALFLLLVVQPIHAAYMLTAEGIDALLHWKASKNLLSVLRKRWPLAVYVLAALLLQFGLQYGADATVLAETYRRRGLILSHLPTAPLTQIVILVLLGFSVWLMRTKRTSDSASRLVPILLVSGLVVLNQSIVHGRDAVFGLYYRYPLSFVLWLSAGWVVLRLLPRRLVTVLAVLACTLSGLHMLQEMIQITQPRNLARSIEFRDSDLRGVMQELAKRPRTEVVLGPIDVSNLVPALTQHYSLFTQYAHFEFAPDKELAERYLLLKSLFPLPPEHTVEGDPLVFGIFAGNAYARNKTMCRLRLTTVDCDKKLPDFIADQSVRTLIESGSIDELALLKRFGVTTVVTERALPMFMQTHCKDPVRVGRYTIFSCRFTDERVIGI